MIKQIITGIIAGIILTLFAIQFDPWVQKQVGESVKKTLAVSLNCSVLGTVRSVNFLMPEITFEDFNVSDSSDKWQWHVKEYRIGFSWMRFLLSAQVDLWMALKDFTIKSQMTNGTIAILSHLQDLMKPAQLSVPLVLQSVIIRNGIFELYDKQTKSFFTWNGQSKKIGGCFRSHFYITNSRLSLNGRDLIQGSVGTITLDALEKAEGVALELRTNLHIDLVGLKEHPRCFVKGTWNQTRGRFSIESADQALRINPIIIKEKEGAPWIEATAHIPLSYMGYLATNNVLPFAGTSTIQLKGTLSAPSFFDVHISCDDIKHWLLRDTVAVRGMLHKRTSSWTGTLGMHMLGASSFVGSCKWDEIDKKGGATFSNTHAIAIPFFPYWKIDKNNCTLQVNVDPTGIESCYRTAALNELLDTQITWTGSFSNNFSTGEATAHGSIGEHSYEVAGTMNSFPFISHGFYYDGHHNSLVSIARKKDAPLIEASFDMRVLRMMLAHFFHYDLQGEGTVHIESTYKDSILSSLVHLHDSTIRLPQTYNFINGFDACVQADFSKKSIIIKNVSCALHAGSLSIPQATVILDEKGALSFVHVPLIFDRCLLNMKQDLFAMVSGSLLLSKKPNQTPLLKGALILDRAQLKENLFSEGFQKKLFQATDSMTAVRDFEVDCDLTIETKDVVRIDTDFLQASAHFNLVIKKQFFDPEITGAITLLSGILAFPYKPLHITKGSVTFLSEQPLNPVVELIAKNSIKQHNVALHVTGSLQDHLVLLESTPPLTEEQIVGLLLAGSHEEALSNVIPALLVQNIANLIFSSHQSTVLERYLKPWMKHINVQLVPRLSEQSGRGGLRGAIEIDVNERWRALIEKNFSLTEDTRFELEYILSDDVRLRVIRDERCDVGGEVEMKWKF